MLDELLNSLNSLISSTLIFIAGSYTRFEYRIKRRVYESIDTDGNANLAYIERNVASDTLNWSKTISIAISRAATSAVKTGQDQSASKNISTTDVEKSLQYIPEDRLAFLFRDLSEDAGTTARRILDEGMKSGLSTETIARNLSAEVKDLSISRASTIARTEIMHAAIESSLATYRKNSSVVLGYMWIAALGPRTCIVCILLHGTIFPLSQPFASHPNCRCVTIPVTSNTLPIQSGLAWFTKQSSAIREAILGPAAMRAIDKGALSINQLSGTYNSPQYGPSRYRRSLKEILGPNATQYYR